MGSDIKKILLASDFSQHSKRILKYGAALATNFEAKILFFHALDSTPTQPYGHTIHPASPEGRKLLSEAKSKMADLMRPYDIPWEPRVSFGNPVPSILELIPKEGIDLAVMARWKLSGMKRLLMGPVVERLVRSALCPILAIHPPASNHFEEKEQPFEKKRIVFGCAYPPDPEVLDIAVQFASRFKADLVLLHTAESPPDQDDPFFLDGPFDDLQRDYQKKLTQGLAQGVSPCLQQKCRIQPLVLPGLPGEEITAFVKENPSDLIVVGVRPSRTLEKFLIGSTTETVLRRAPCPILTVPTRSFIHGERANGH